MTRLEEELECLWGGVLELRVRGGFIYIHGEGTYQSRPCQGLTRRGESAG